MSALPSGFAWANKMQEEAFRKTGSVNGASKVTVVVTEGEALLAVRLRPPRTWADITSDLIRKQATARGLCATKAKEWYVEEYNRGWAASGRPGVNAEWDSGYSSHAFDDGYLDRAAGRPKWHLTYCPDHDVCGEG